MENHKIHLFFQGILCFFFHIVSDHISEVILSHNEFIMKLKRNYDNIPNIPQDYSKNVMTCNGTPWNSKESHGIAWDSMECHGSPNNPMEFHGISMQFLGRHEFHAIHGYPNTNFWFQIHEFHGFLLRGDGGNLISTWNPGFQFPVCIP